MYREDVPQIARLGATAPGLASIMVFALLSVRTQFSTLQTQMRDVRARGEASQYLWGVKRQGYRDVREKSAAIAAQLPLASDEETVALIAREITGLGMVKSGFVAQMLGRDVGCIDVRNAHALGLSAREHWLRLDDVSMRSWPKRIARYIRFCQDHGGAEGLWDTWCDGIGPSMGLTGDQVSKFHLKILSGGRNVS